LPPSGSPFERILYGARSVTVPVGAELEIRKNGIETISDTRLWLAPWRGTPHPISKIEQKFAALLLSDSELAPLFRFNQFVETVRGSRPKVDLVWIDGRLVVELDGYPDHSTPRAFLGDRHRDYELTLSGYTVLRLANEEILQDYGRAIEKIRDLVRWRRSQMNEEK
jgi:very-short-patch-repair endonuclease